MTATEQIASRRTYQRTIPLAIMSFLIVVLTVQYFNPDSSASNPLNSFKTGLLGMGTSVALLVQIFGVFTLLLWRTRSVVRRTGGINRQVYSSVVFLLVFVIFILLGLSTPQLNNGATYQLLYMTFIGTLTTTATGIKFVHHAFWTFRLFASVSTPESAVLFLAWLFTYIRESAFLTAAWSGFQLIGDTIELYVFAAASRALLLSTAVAAMIIAARALVGKEPGLIDMEMVQ